MAATTATATDTGTQDVLLDRAHQPARVTVSKPQATPCLGLWITRRGRGAQTHTPANGQTQAGNRRTLFPMPRAATYQCFACRRSPHVRSTLFRKTHAHTRRHERASIERPHKTEVG